MDGADEEEREQYEEYKKERYRRAQDEVYICKYTYSDIYIETLTYLCTGIVRKLVMT
jgi:hypothetical protein